MFDPLPKPAIVVAAWNRPHSLKRLLEGLAKGDFPADTTLHISIDHFEYDDVARMAEEFIWPHGTKHVEKHPARLGLRQHLLHCGGLSAQYGSIVLLEDDLVVSPFAYAYAQASLAYFVGDETIAGISLYNYAVTESCHQPFQPWLDEWDNWFLQLPSSWGAAFTAEQWQGFQDWLAGVCRPSTELLLTVGKRLPVLPDYIERWPAQSWKKLLAAYLIATGKYFSYPRFSLSTNFEDFGTHANTRGLFQVPLLMGKRDWRFGRLQASMAVYDAHFEPLAENLQRICPLLEAYDFVVDLLGQKSRAFLHRPWVLTRRKGGEVQMSFSATAIPLELNLYWPGSGDELRLVAADSELTAVDALELEFRYYSGVAKTAGLHLPDRRMPSISVIVDCTDESAAVTDVFNQEYPGREFVFVVEPGKMPDWVWSEYKNRWVRVVEASGTAFDRIQKGVSASTGQLIHILSDDLSPFIGLLEKVAHVFRQFPGLDWLSGLPGDREGISLSRQMAPYRWDSDRFRDANEQEIAHFLPNSLQVFRRALWMKTQGATTLQQQFRQMGMLSLPQVSTLEFGDMEKKQPSMSKSWWGVGKVNRTRRFYHAHIPLLWKWHRRLSDYRPVLRYDAKHNTWFEFDY